MFYSYAINRQGCKPIQLGLYTHTFMEPVVVTLDPGGQRVAFSNDKASVELFSDQILGYITGGYEMAMPGSYVEVGKLPHQS